MTFKVSDIDRKNINEVDLFELIKIIWTKKFFVFMTTAFFMFVSFIFSFSKPEIYEVSSIVEVGYFKSQTNFSLLEDIDVLINKANVIYNLNVPSDNLTRLSYIGVLAGRNINDRLIKLKVQSTDNKQGLLLMDKILTEIKSYHLSKIKNYLSEVENKHSFLQKELLEQKRYHDELAKIVDFEEKNIKNLLTKSTDESIVYALIFNGKMNDLSAIRHRIFTLKKEISVNVSKLSDTNFKYTQALGEIIVNTSPSTSNKAFLVLVGLTLGLFCSVSFTLILFYFRCEKGKISEV